MKNMIGHLLFVAVIATLFSCSQKEAQVNPIQAQANDFTFMVNRISEQPLVQFPNDELLESDYEEITQVLEYSVSLNEDMQTVSIMPNDISGKMIEDEKGVKVYDLDQGLFAGGRFIVWIADSNYEAEFTIYGSGVPIIRSERGYLLPSE